MATSKSIGASRRGLENLRSGRLIDNNNDVSSIPRYDPESCPDGLVDVSGGVNTMMGDFFDEYMAKEFGSYNLSHALRYGGVIGPPDLALGMSKYFNKYFSPSVPVKPEDILVTNGVTALLDIVAYNVCDSGEGIMCLTPTYSMYDHDLCAHSNVEFIPVPTNTVKDQFKASSAGELIKALVKAYDGAVKRGIRVKGVLICNPSNPEGRFYSRHTLQSIARFCGQRKLHLISDEIYALSSFDSPEEEKHLELDGFTSVSSIKEDPKNSIYTENIHFLYGASKDFGMGGLRLGFLVTRDKELWKTCRRLAPFTWISTFSATVFTRFIQDEVTVEAFHKLNRQRIKNRYVELRKALEENKIPYGPANGGLFVWIKLEKWLVHFPGDDIYREGGKATRETQLSSYLVKKGVYMSQGELSYSSTPGCFRFVYTAGEGAILAIKRIGDALIELEKSETFSGNTTTMGDDECLSQVSTLTREKEELQAIAGGYPRKTTALQRISARLNCFGGKDHQ